MKKLFTTLLIICSLNTFGQQIKGDTLIIEYSDKVRFVKIGNDVYQIESPKLKLVEAPLKLSTVTPFTDSTLYWRYGSRDIPVISSGQKLELIKN